MPAGVSKETGNSLSGVRDLMRSDMAKVIVERPRYGSRVRGKPKGYRRRLQRLSMEGLPRREGIKKRSQGGTKSLNEHLGPLRRFLESRVGHPWNKVFSEICERVDRSSAVQDHVRDHVEDYVAVHVVLLGGVPCLADGLPLARCWKKWYVCPRSGLLKKVKRGSRKLLFRHEPSPPPRYVQLGKWQQCRLVHGAWHLVTLQRLPAPPAGSKAHDVLLDRCVSSITTEEAVRTYGAPVYAVAVRPLGKRERKQFPIPLEWQ